MVSLWNEENFTNQKEIDGKGSRSFTAWEKLFPDQQLSPALIECVSYGLVYLIMQQSLSLRKFSGSQRIICWCQSNVWDGLGSGLVTN